MNLEAFGKLPGWLIYTVAFKGLKKRASALQALMVIVAIRNDRTGETRVSMNVIAERIGQCEKTARRAVAVLLETRLIFRLFQGAGPGNPSVYRLADPIADGLEMEPDFTPSDNGEPAKPDTYVSASEPPKADTRVSGIPPTKADTCAPKGGQFGTENRTPAPPKADTRMSASKSIQSSQRRQRASRSDRAPTGAGGDVVSKGEGTKPIIDAEEKDAIREELLRAGVNPGPKLIALVSGGLTLAEIRAEITAWRDGPNPSNVGFLIQAIAGQSERRQRGIPLEQPEKPGALREFAQREKTRLADEERRFEQAAAEAQSWGRATEDAELVEAYHRMIAGYPNRVGVCLQPPDGYSIQEKAAFIRAHLSVEVHGFVLEEQRQAPESP